MRVTALSDRLFFIEDLLPEYLVTKIIQTNWGDLAWTKENDQAHWARRRIDPCPLTEEINQYIYGQHQAIGQAMGVVFNNAETAWWVDEPGFTVPLHTDGHLPSSMQLFWTGVSEEYGTVFYDYKNTDHVQHAFKFVTNSGYAMLNQPLDNGAQPLSWHGMTNPVPKNTLRVTSYTRFGNYTDK